jgi:thiol-disulfide isomerase/thioredoxin
VTATEPDAKPTWGRRLLGLVRELLVLAAVFVVGLVVFGWLRAPSLPDEAPTFTLPTVGGGSLALTDLRGRPTVLNFWATWCGPCRVELPTLVAFSEAHPELTVVGVAVDDPAAVARMVTQSGISYPIVIADHATVEAYGVSTFPTTVVLDADGRVVTAHTGIVIRPQLEVLARLAR